MTDRTCDATLGLEACSLPQGHEGDHRSSRRGVAVTWTTVTCTRILRTGEAPHQGGPETPADGHLRPDAT